MIRTLLLLTVATYCTACEPAEGYELATSELSYIELDVDGQTLLLNAIPSVTVNSYYQDSEGEQLYIEHATADNTHLLSIALSGCDLGQSATTHVFGTKATGNATCVDAQSVTISYTTLSLAGSAHCPYLTGEPNVLSGTVVIESWAEDGLVTGTFEADALEGHPLSGRFQTYVY